MKSRVLASFAVAVAVAVSLGSFGVQAEEERALQTQLDQVRADVEVNQRTISDLQVKLTSQRKELDDNEANIAEKSALIAELRQEIKEIGEGEAP